MDITLPLSAISAVSLGLATYLFKLLHSIDTRVSVLESLDHSQIKMVERLEAKVDKILERDE